MSTTYFPRNNAERGLCISRLASSVGEPDANAILIMLDKTACQAPRDA